MRRGRPSRTPPVPCYTGGEAKPYPSRLMFIETSKDLLFVVLAFCVLWLTVFISWLLYYVIAIVRDAESLVRQVRGAVTKIDQLAGVAHAHRAGGEGAHRVGHPGAREDEGQGAVGPPQVTIRGLTGRGRSAIMPGRPFQ
jgi:hypothetical protein